MVPTNQQWFQRNIDNSMNYQWIDKSFMVPINEPQLAPAFNHFMALLNNVPGTISGCKELAVARTSNHCFCKPLTVS